MIYAMKCKHVNREGARSCLKCGAKLESVCPICGAKQMGNSRDVGWAHGTLGYISMAQQNWDEAVFHFQMIYEMYQKLGNKSLLAFFGSKHGKAYLISNR